MMNHPKRAKILCVDDDSLIKKLLSHLLERQGFEVRTASNGQEGVEMAREWLPDLILMDLMMPVMDGFQAAAALRADPRTRHIPIVARTSMSGVSVQVRTQEVGINSLVLKTSSLNDLLKSLHPYLPSSE